MDPVQLFILGAAGHAITSLAGWTTPLLTAPTCVGEHAGAASPPAAGAPAPPAQRPYGCASCYFTGGHATGRSIAGKLNRLPLALHLHGLALCHGHHPPDVIHPLAHHGYRGGR